MKGGNIDEEEEGRKRGTLRGSNRDRGRYVGGALEDEGALSPSEDAVEDLEMVLRRTMIRKEAGVS